MRFKSIRDVMNPSNVDPSVIYKNSFNKVKSKSPQKYTTSELHTSNS